MQLNIMKSANTVAAIVPAKPISLEYINEKGNRAMKIFYADWEGEAFWNTKNKRWEYWMPKIKSKIKVKKS